MYFNSRPSPVGSPPFHIIASSPPFVSVTTNNFNTSFFLQELQQADLRGGVGLSRAGICHQSHHFMHMARILEPMQVLMAHSKAHHVVSSVVRINCANLDRRGKEVLKERGGQEGGHV